MTYLLLFLEFFKTGLFAVGGGLATLPFLYDIAQTKGWFSTDDIANMIAVAESTPGAIGVNMATFAGYITGGIAGVLAAVIGLTMPAIVVIMLVAKVLDKFKTSPLVSSSFYGLRPASMAMITMAGLTVAKVAFLDLDAFQASGDWSVLFLWKAMLLGILIFFGQKYLKKVHPIAFIVIAAVAGILFKM